MPQLYNLPAFHGKHIVFVGAGREGKSFEEFIQKHVVPASFRFVDKTEGENYLESLKELDLETTIIVKTPGVPGRLMPVPYTTPTRVFFDCVKQQGSTTVGITGTKGKSTTSKLVYDILRNGGKQTLLAGNIGTPMLDTLELSTSETIFVLELSSYQLAELETSPDIAIITNLYKDHTDYHGSIDLYWEAKHNIMRYMGENGKVIFNPQTEMVLHWLAESKAQQFPINPDEQVDFSKSKLFGDHNKLNYLMARQVSTLLGVEKFVAQSTLTTFDPIPHRLQIVKEFEGVTYVDDAIASQPEAAVAAIEACIRYVKPVGCMMLGGQDRDYDFSQVVKMVSTLRIPALVLFPDTGAKIKEQLPEGYTPQILETSDMEQAVQWASKNTPSGSICLLSTASPSYSIWKDFEEKGDLFQKAVLKL